jgi:hypothetical protein
MITPDTARSACEAVWLAMIELAETVNDGVVARQRDMNATASDTISGLTGDLATLANAASVLARYMSRAP